MSRFVGAGIARVFHPSDFREGSESAFAHALRLALAAKAKLDILHVAPEADVEWSDFPGVRRTLEQWGLLPAGSDRTAVPALGIDVRKVVKRESDPVEAATSYLEEHPADLVVLATSEGDGRMGWLHRSVAKPIARAAKAATLFVPHGARGFVDPVDGTVRLRRILVPVDQRPDPDWATRAAVSLADALALPTADFTVLHAGPDNRMPDVLTDERTGWTWNWIAREGDPVETILAAAAEGDADLVVMATSGRSGFLDALRGSTTERVLRGARRPLLAVPAPLEDLGPLSAS
jgi:nucleotide-binding universal stress UspA family protein